ncbi:MAG: hypothetical protein ACRCZI_03015 [Cetobacterium sp.]
MKEVVCEHLQVVCCCRGLGAIQDDDFFAIQYNNLFTCGLVVATRRRGAMGDHLSVGGVVIVTVLERKGR